MAKLSIELPDSNFFVEVRLCPHSDNVKPGDRLREFTVYCKLGPYDDVVVKPDSLNEPEKS